MELTAEMAKSLLEKVPAMTAEERATSLTDVILAYLELLATTDEYRRHETEMVRQYVEEKERRCSLENDVERYIAVVENLEAQLKDRTTTLFGRSSESLSHLSEEITGDGASDPLTEDAKADNEASKDVSQARASSASSKSGHPKRTGKQASDKRKKMLENLPVAKEYVIDPKALDEEYGAGNWRIAGWQEHRHIEVVKSPVYVKETMTPILSIGVEHRMERVFYDDFAPHSLASESLVAYCMYNKYALGVPTYRQEASFQSSGIAISRQAIVRWINGFSSELFTPVYQHLAMLLLSRPYQQCDETTKTIIKDGRAPGAKSYIWVHMTSELTDGPRIVIYSQELTRGTEHLRSFYAMCELENLVITSDAYASYQLFEKESEGSVRSAGCLMHLRRRFFKAAQLLHLKDLDESAQEKFPEIKAIALIAEIYMADEPLKDLPAKERLAKRQVEVKEKVDAFFEFIHEQDPDDPTFGCVMKDAICYAINQEVYLRRFLEDASIPCDNGACERLVKPLAMVRKNSLFSFSIGGAKCDAMIQSLVETARLNGADPYYYLRYLLEKMPAHVRGFANLADQSYLPDMMPWSDAYKEYEDSARFHLLSDLHFDVEVKAPKIAHDKHHNSYIAESA